MGREVPTTGHKLAHTPSAPLACCACAVASSSLDGACCNHAQSCARLRCRSPAAALHSPPHALQGQHQVRQHSATHTCSGCSGSALVSLLWSEGRLVATAGADPALLLCLCDCVCSAGPRDTLDRHGAAARRAAAARAAATPNHAFSGRSVQRWPRKTRTSAPAPLERLAPSGKGFCRTASSNPLSESTFEHGLMVYVMLLDVLRVDASMVRRKHDRGVRPWPPRRRVSKGHAGNPNLRSAMTSEHVLTMFLMLHLVLMAVALLFFVLFPCCGTHSA